MERRHQYFYWGLLLVMCCMASNVYAAPSSPGMMTPPMRLFLLDEAMNPLMGKPLAPDQAVTPQAGKYLCSEVLSGEVLLFSPSASKNRVYVKMELTPQGASYMDATPRFYRW